MKRSELWYNMTDRRITKYRNFFKKDIEPKPQGKGGRNEPAENQKNQNWKK
jgi:hypothetical protein